MSDEPKKVNVTLISPDFRAGQQYNVGDELEVEEWELPNLVQARLIAPYPVASSQEDEATQENVEAVSEEQHRLRADHQEDEEK
jgi:hypothetical protein